MPRRAYVSGTCLELLIELVIRQNPCLYDPTLSSHKDAVIVENVWKSISKQLTVDSTSRSSVQSAVKTMQDCTHQLVHPETGYKTHSVDGDMETHHYCADG